MRSTRVTPSIAPLERAFLVGITLPRVRREDELQNLSELELLARSAGAEVVGRTLQSRTRVDGTTFVGKGKIEELAREIHDRGANLVIFDDDLTPAQARNIEKILEVNVIDRTELILDIFARRARTRQARIQVEIAQLNYALPRLRRLWEHLGRQAGGIGTRGPGETQIEVDRRKARDRIASLERELEKIHRGAEERRKRREGLFTVTIVGYTNAGKSTLLNRIAGSGVLESDRLFSTLDSTTRRVMSPGGEPFLLTDTIGFIRKLPTHLVDSFKVTLLDVREADLLLHVADASIDRCDEHIAVVNAVLDDVLAKGGRGDAPRRRERSDRSRSQQSRPHRRLRPEERAPRQAPGGGARERRDGRRDGRASRRSSRLTSARSSWRRRFWFPPRTAGPSPSSNGLRRFSRESSRGDEWFSGCGCGSGRSRFSRGKAPFACDSRRPHKPDGISRLNRSRSPSIVTHGYLRTISARCEARAGLAALSA